MCVTAYAIRYMRASGQRRGHDPPFGSIVYVNGFSYVSCTSAVEKYQGGAQQTVPHRLGWTHWFLSDQGRWSRTFARTLPRRANVVASPLLTPDSSRCPMLIWMEAWSFAVISLFVQELQTPTLNVALFFIRYRRWYRRSKH